MGFTLWGRGKFSKSSSNHSLGLFVFEHVKDHF